MRSHSASLPATLWRSSRVFDVFIFWGWQITAAAEHQGSKPQLSDSLATPSLHHLLLCTFSILSSYLFFPFLFVFASRYQTFSFLSQSCYFLSKVELIKFHLLIRSSWLLLSYLPFSASSYSAHLSSYLLADLSVAVLRLRWAKTWLSWHRKRGVLTLKPCKHQRQVVKWMQSNNNYPL